MEFWHYYFAGRIIEAEMVAVLQCTASCLQAKSCVLVLFSDAGGKHPTCCAWFNSSCFEIEIIRLIFTTIEDVLFGKWRQTNEEAV